MNWYMTILTLHDKVVQKGWMLAETDKELIDYARTMGYSIDIRLIGKADMKAVTCEVLKGLGRTRRRNVYSRLRRSTTRSTVAVLAYLRVQDVWQKEVGGFQ